MTPTVIFSELVCGLYDISFPHCHMIQSVSQKQIILHLNHPTKKLN